MRYFLDTEFLEGTQKTWLGQTKPTIDLISIGIVCEDGREYYAISKDFNLKEAWNRWQQRTGQGDYNNINPKEYWIRDNVLKPIYNELVLHHTSTDWYHKNPHLGEKVNDGRWLEFNYKSLKWLINKYGKNNKQIAEEIKEFCKPIEGHPYLVGIDSYEEVNIGRENTIIPAKHWTETIGERTAPKFYGYYSDYDWVVFCWLFGKMIDLPKGFPMYCIDLKQTLDEKAWSTYCNNGTLNSETSLEERLKYLKGESNTHLIEPNKPKYPKQTNEHNALADARWNYELYKFLNAL